MYILWFSPSAQLRSELCYCTYSSVSLILHRCKNHWHANVSSFFVGLATNSLDHQSCIRTNKIIKLISQQTNSCGSFIWNGVVTKISHVFLSLIQQLFVCVYFWFFFQRFDPKYKNFVKKFINLHVVLRI